MSELQRQHRIPSPTGLVPRARRATLPFRGVPGAPETPRPPGPPVCRDIARGSEPFFLTFEPRPTCDYGPSCFRVGIGGESVVYQVAFDERVAGAVIEPWRRRSTAQ